MTAVGALPRYDRIILGAGLYGLFAARFCARRGEKVLVLEYDGHPFSRATHLNQARIHNGYHYPRSLSTARKSARYFNRFVEEFQFCVKADFTNLYATAAKHSWTDAQQFQKFCRAAGIKCEGVEPDRYFKPGLCEGVFGTQEYTYDAVALRAHFVREIAQYPNLECRFNARVGRIERNGPARVYELYLEDGTAYATGFVLNATYASVNQILALAGLEPFKLKYELCEIILCQVSAPLQQIGLTVMDGPFFSLIPFGLTGYHSLTSVTFTPHHTAYGVLPDFACQQTAGAVCSPRQLGNCNSCPGKPKTAWGQMHSLARKFLPEAVRLDYGASLFSIKPILLASEIDDSRPTLIRQFSRAPTLVTVLSGKINTMYDLEGILGDGD